MLRFNDASVLSSISRPRRFEITGIHHLVLEAHQRAVELGLQSDAEQRVNAVVFEGLAAGRRNRRGDVQVFGEGRLPFQTKMPARPNRRSLSVIHHEPMTEASMPRMSVCCSTSRVGKAPSLVRCALNSPPSRSPLRRPATCSAPSRRRRCSSGGFRRHCRNPDVVDVRLERFISNRRAEPTAAEFVRRRRAKQVFPPVPEPREPLPYACRHSSWLTYVKHSPRAGALKRALVTFSGGYERDIK